MKQLILLRGAPGVGQTAFIHERSLQSYTLSSEQFWTLLQSPSLSVRGEIEMPLQIRNKDVWHLLYESLEMRMSQGEFVIVDATHSKTSEMAAYQALADKYRYDITLVDFTSVPMDMAQNTLDDEFDQVSKESIEKIYFRFKTEQVPKGIHIVNFLRANLQYQPQDFSWVRRIHHIGDIHGCYDVLMDYFEDGLRKDELYIFTGDYFSRGSESVKVFRFLESIMNLPNVILLEGNHESYLWKWVNYEKSNSAEFENRTRVEFEKGGITRKQAKRFCLRLKEAVYYTYYEKHILVTHGGLPVIPKNLRLISSKQLIQGVGDYETQIDSIFEARERNPNHYQVHGHRNPSFYPMKQYPRSINLDGQVDSGGELRIAVLGRSGFSFVAVDNSAEEGRGEMSLG